LLGTLPNNNNLRAFVFGFAGVSTLATFGFFVDSTVIADNINFTQTNLAF
jgi:hypothetical protein